MPERHPDPYEGMSDEEFEEDFRQALTGHRDVHKGDFAEAWKLLGEVAAVDPWDWQYEPGYEGHERTAEMCQFCFATRPLGTNPLYVGDPDHPVEVSKATGEHKPDCLWVRTRAFLERFRA